MMAVDLSSLLIMAVLSTCFSPISRNIPLLTPSNRTSVNLSSPSNRASLNLSNFDRGVLPDQERAVFKNPLFGLDEEGDELPDDDDQDSQHPGDGTSLCHSSSTAFGWLVTP